MMENDFEMLWLQQRKSILKQNREYQEALDGYKMKNGADWLLYAIPVVAGIIVSNLNLLKSELLNFVLACVVALVLFVVTIWIKSLIYGVPNLGEIEERIKEQCREEFQRSGKLQ